MYIYNYICVHTTPQGGNGRTPLHMRKVGEALQTTPHHKDGWGGQHTTSTGGGVGNTANHITSAWGTHPGGEA